MRHPAQPRVFFVFLAFFWLLHGCGARADVDGSGAREAAGLATPALPSSSASVDPAKTFRILPIYDALTGTKLSDADLQAAMVALRHEVGENRRYFRVGFSHIYGGVASLTRNTRAAAQNNLSIGTIIALQTHSVNRAIAATAAKDLRNYQWRLDGVTWQGQAVTTGGSQQFPARDWKVVTPSRYATGLHAAFVQQAAQQGKEIASVMQQFPGTIVAVNGAIEEELATAGEANDAYLGDYSPFAVAEFRDWLRHTGIYDDATGAHRGEGAPAAIVGSAVLGGVARSPFYDDPSPADSHGTGQSFNAVFGTRFTTWALRSWDLDRNPNALTDPNFTPSPQAGAGYVAGGFDAPRVRDTGSAYWNAWSYDILDHGRVYPPGNPAAPAFGFRQALVKHFLADLFAAVGQSVPANLLYPHQIPGEQAAVGRARSGADPVWTARLDSTGNLGSTRFGTYDAVLARSYSPNWGIFEWHPKPGAAKQDPALYNVTLAEMNKFYANDGYCFFPGWWNDRSGTFPLNGSNFALALHDWLAAQPDVGR